MKYRKKPIVVSAHQTECEVVIHTLEGDMKATPGDYIIIGVNGEQYPCEPDIFEKTYEPYHENQQERSKGCDYCDAEPFKDCVCEDGTEQMLCVHPEHQFNPFVKIRQINFCPMCGRKLNNPQ